MTTTVKTSVSLQKPLWHLLRNVKNKSRVINEALEMYFDKQKFLQESDKQYWEMVGKSLAGKRDEYVSLNPKGEGITNELLEKELWN